MSELDEELCELNLESATGEELGRLLSAQTPLGEQNPSLSGGRRHGKREERELHCQPLDDPPASP